VGYTVQLLAGEVVIPADRFAKALDVLKKLDRDRDDLKTGRRRDVQGELVPCWAFVDRDLDLQEIDSFPDMLRALRFEPVLLPDGDLLGVLLEGCHRSRGDEFDHWSALAPLVQRGSRMDWLGEDGAVWRWRFDGSALVVVPGTLTFDE